MEYAVSVRVKVAPSPSMSDTTGAIFRGSVTELVSSGLLALIVIILPFGSTPANPLISTRTGCEAPARLTSFR
jgi:hypothetical protein